MAAAPKPKVGVTGAEAKKAAVAKATDSAKAKRKKGASQQVEIKLSLAETIRLPYPPTNFKRRDMRRIVAEVKRARGE